MSTSIETHPVQLGHSLYLSDPDDPDVTDSGSIPGGLVCEIRTVAGEGEPVEEYTCIRWWANELKVTHIRSDRPFVRRPFADPGTATTLCFKVLQRMVQDKQRPRRNGAPMRFEPRDVVDLERALFACRVAAGLVI